MSYKQIVSSFLSPCVSCGFLLVIHLIHNNVYMSIPISRFIPPVLSSLGIHVCSLRMCLSALHIDSPIQFCSIPHMCIPIPCLICKEIQPVHPKGNQSWLFIGRTDAEAEAPVLWPPDAKNWLVGKDPDSGKDWRQEEKGTMASRTRWTWVWASSRSWWWTGRPGVLQSRQSQSRTQNWVAELNWYHVCFSLSDLLHSLW